jgi:hypothetical protein
MLRWTPLLFVMLAACSEDSPAAVARASDPQAPAGPDEPDPSSWPADVRGLDDSLEALAPDGCVEALRSEMPVDVAEALGDIGYDTIYQDVCAGLEAVRTGSAASCDELTATPLQRGCRTRVALRSGEPAHCPPGVAHGGRDPVCVAWAARDPGLCRASRTEREHCEAVLAGDEARCPAHERARCEAAVQRYAQTIAGERHESDAAAVEPTFELHATATAAGASAAQGREGREPVVVRRRDVVHGVVLAPAIGQCAHTLSLGAPGDEAPGVHAFLDRDPSASLALTLPVGAAPPFDVPMGLDGARLRVSLPGVGVGDSTIGARGRVTVEALDRTRGGAVTLSIDADLPLTPGRLLVRGTIRTFVRDLDPPDACARPPE